MKTNKPCALCNKPASDRHHLLSHDKRYIKIYGTLIDEPFNIIYLCNNCHLTRPVPKFSELEFRQEAEKQGYILPEMSKSLQFKTM
jgi:hypothetical protein